MIPVLIAPVVSRWDQFDRMIESLDEPVWRLVVVDQTSGLGSHVGLYAPDYVTEVIRPLIPLGYGGAINAAIGQTPGVPWWLFVSGDVAFGPGDLAAITQLIEAADGPAFVTGDKNDDRLLRCAYGAVNVAAIEAVGLFDEWAFYPAYFEDDDWERRCRLGGVQWIEYNGQIEHERSSTIRSNPQWAERNRETFAQNLQNYIEKWHGVPGSESFSTPYGLPVPLCFTRPDPAGRALRKW
jgi:GT2 family glycosyltransferase